MSRLDLDHTVQCAIPLEKARQITLDVLKVEKWRVKDQYQNTLEFLQGSQFKTRFIGGWLCNPAWFPAKLKLTVRQTLDATFVDLHFEEALGFGILDPLFKERYRDRFNACINAIGFALTHPSHAPIAL